MYEETKSLYTKMIVSSQQQRPIPPSIHTRNHQQQVLHHHHHYCNSHHNHHFYCRRRTGMNRKTLFSLLMLLLGSIVVIVTTLSSVQSFSWDNKNHRIRSSFIRCSVSQRNHLCLLKQQEYQQPLQQHHKFMSTPTVHNKWHISKRLTTQQQRPNTRLHTTPTKAILSSYNPLLPLLDVGLDQPLYPPIIKRMFWETLIGSIIGMPYAIRNMISYVTSLIQKVGQIVLSSQISIRLFQAACILSILMITMKYLYVSINQIRTNTAIKNAIPMPFKPNVNDGWSICKLQKVEKYGKTPTILVTMKLPSSKYVLPLQLGQTIHICGLDRDSNAIQAEFYPFHESNDGQQQVGRFSLLLPDPTSAIIPTLTSDIDESTLLQNNDIQKVRVAQLLQDYIRTGDTEIAIHPGVTTTKLVYRGTAIVNEINYLVIGSTGIVPVLDQIRAVLSNQKKQSDTKRAVVDRISVVWINPSMNEFDLLSNVLRNIYEEYSTELLVICGIEPNLNPNSKNSSLIQDIAIDYLYQNNVEINDTLESYRSGMMTIISIDNDVDPYSSQYLRNGAVRYLQEQKLYPIECICVL